MPKVRRLWLNVKLRIPRGVPRAEAKGALLDSIRNGSYELPKGYEAEIHWRNKEDAPMRVGEWANELSSSAASSPGFERALDDWIRRNMRG